MDFKKKLDLNGLTYYHSKLLDFISIALDKKANNSHKHGNSDITALDASKITSGTISVARLPKAALERCVVVANDAERFKLTTSSVQTGDTVKVTGTGKMYFVVDDSKLTSEDGYEVYILPTANTSVKGGVTLNDTYTSTSGASSGVAASAKSVNNLYKDLTRKNPYTLEAGYITNNDEHGYSVKAYSYIDIPIEFTQTFNKAPHILVSLYTQSINMNMSQVTVCALNSTTDGFTVRVFNNSPSELAPAIEWLALI